MFDWSQYLELARFLTGDPDAKPSDEAKARTSISRSYYCIFHLARVFLKEEGDINISRKLPDAHRYVINQLKNRDEKKLSQIGNHLERLRDDRVYADYDDGREIYLEEAERTSNFASWLKAQIEKEIRLLHSRKRH